MVIRVRRWVARRLAAASICVSPDPKLTFTTRRIDVDYPDLNLVVNTMAAHVARDIVGRDFTPGRGIEVSY